MRILLIDDDKDDQLLFTEAVRLISPGIQCDQACNGEEGLRKLRSYVSLPRLVFLDINMPIMDGRETLKQIRKSPALKTLNVIIYSTSNNAVEKQNFLNDGVSFITKPNSFEQLVDVISKPILDAYKMRPSNNEVLLYSNL